jgi:hypothetical protein
VLPPTERTVREQRYVDYAIARVIRTRNAVQEEIVALQNRFYDLGGDEHAAERAEIMVRLSRLSKLRFKLDNDYGHWDAIDDNGYDKDDPDDYNYPPPSPPPPSLVLFVGGE